LSQPLKRIPIGSLVRIKHYYDFEPQEDLYIVVRTEPMSPYELNDHRAEHYTFCYVIAPVSDPHDFKKYHYHNELVVVSSS
jgi:hypothetical protein